LPLVEAAPRLRAELSQDAARIALLFGSEKTGLSNEELSHCHWLLTIPMQSHPGLRHASMNLGQAVAVCLYELVREPVLLPLDDAAPEPRANAAVLERLTTLFHELLERTEYTRHHPANSDLPHLRRLVLRLAADATDAAVWMGILRQALWKLRALAPEGD
jgi:tRNA/rRNA methyltransferase